jgi:hypothetical protein
VLTFFDQAKNNTQIYISNYIILNYPTKQGSLAQQLEFIKKLGKSIPTILNGKDIPTQIELNAYEQWIYIQWQEVGRSRINIDSGPQPISDSNIKDYMSIMEEDLRYIDIRIIKDIDKAYLDELAHQQELNNKE